MIKPSPSGSSSSKAAVIVLLFCSDSVCTVSSSCAIACIRCTYRSTARILYQHISRTALVMSKISPKKKTGRLRKMLYFASYFHPNAHSISKKSRFRPADSLAR